MTGPTPTLGDLRTAFHHDLSTGLWGQRVSSAGPVSKTVRGVSFPVFTNADKHHNASVVLASESAHLANVPPAPRPGAGGSETGIRFERATREFVAGALDRLRGFQTRDLQTLPGQAISNFSQYAHLDDIQALIEEDEELQVALGGDYVVTPDIVVAFDPLSDSKLAGANLVLGNDDAGDRSPIRSKVSATPLLHASISCKWTMRRDRAQNTRTEALNLVRNRKGRLPHIVVVTMECAPDIIASIALGTGDIDCVYHGALPELLEAADSAAKRWGGSWKQGAHSLHAMADGSRLRDVSDLPLDLLI